VSESLTSFTKAEPVTETLRRSAEHTMHALVRTVFSRLHSIDPEAEEARLQSGVEDVPDGEIKMTVQTTADVEEDAQVVAVHQSNPDSTIGLKSLAIPRIDRPQCMSNQFLYSPANIDLHRWSAFDC
jgi:golgi-specific brefeldin A-resistance guanine nucleotide exchange factor 1